MKTLGLTLGLLLCMLCCAAQPRAVMEIAPGNCCFQFFTGRVPAKQIISITKTHNRCMEKAFVVHTAAGRNICVSQIETWALKAFNNLQDVRAK